MGGIVRGVCNGSQEYAFIASPGEGVAGLVSHVLKVIGHEAPPSPGVFCKSGQNVGEGKCSEWGGLVAFRPGLNSSSFPSYPSNLGQNA